MKRVLLVALAAVGAVLAAPLTTQQYEFLFTRFVDQYQKNYEVSTFFQKYNTFKTNLDYVLAENSKGKSYTLAMNEFGDLTSAEFKAKMLGFRGEEAALLRQRTAAPFDGVVAETPSNDDSFDWNNQGAVTPVKNQGQCGSCWAFSAVGSMEASWKIKSGTLVSMSEQQLVDCSGSTGNQGCNGGLMDKAFQYVIKNGGICGESGYPYTARGGSCKATTCTKVAKFTSFKDVTQGSETALMSAVKVTAVSVAVEADRSAWQFYSSGVLDDSSCGTSLDHGVLLVGYGTQGKQYWRVKNSWGTSWGESGYIRLVRNKNQCGVASMASYIVA